MRKLLLSLGLLVACVTGAFAQVPCGGVNFTPSPGVSCLLEPTAPSYGATAVALVPASAATDIACLTGSATKIIRLQMIRVSGTGTAQTFPILVRKNASADSGGTPATSTALPVPYSLDSLNPAVTATTTSWTANPTVNDSAPGILDSGVLFIAATSTSTAMPYVTFDYQERNFTEAIILRGVAQQVCVNLNGTTETASLNVTFRWTELPQ